MSYLVGREKETAQIRACLRAKRNVLLEGPVGVGKTHLALSVVQSLGIPVFRVDGDSRYSEQKLSGWFEPPLVIQKGFTEESFLPGPLVSAMQKGGVLFINELNRLPEGVQNVLLPAIDERLIVVPRLGEVKAQPGFLVIATQNPKEFVATSHLSEAILDRFELIVLDYQTEEEEIAIVSQKLKSLGASSKAQPELLSKASVRLARITRDHPQVKRGASVRAAQAIAEIATVLIGEGEKFSDAFLSAVMMALPTRIEIERDADSPLTAQEELKELLEEWVETVLEDLDSDSKSLKKKL